MIVRLIDLWLARRAETSQQALAAVAKRRPIVVVTGGSRGIGLALARRFAKAGHNVAIIARQAEPLQTAAEKIAKHFRVAALAIPLDVTDADAARRIDARLAAEGFYLDILINCAGVGSAGPFDSRSQTEIEEVLSLNVAALTRLMHHALPDMLARGDGGIINVASLGGLVPGPGQATYYASKAYVISLTRAVATEISGRGVRLMALAPGPVDTGFHARMGAELSFYRQLVMAPSTGSTARAAYRAYLLGFRLFVPGVTAKLLQVAVWIIPHALLMPLMAWLLRRREEHPWNGDAANET